ncbi:MAG: acyl--CoA ligase [Gemmatimonadetes bacterium]|nr:acyl--CoA ligase [Gemmatimonadota bacterium]
MNVVDVLALSAGEPDRVAVVSDGRTITYDELDELVSKRADDLDAGQIALVVLEPTLEGVLELLAQWRAGRVPVPLNSRLTSTEIERARRVLADAAIPDGTHVVLWTSGTQGVPRGVALSWANLEASARAAADRLALGRDDAWVASLSPAHVGGLALITRSLLLGGVLVMPRGHDTAELSTLLDEGLEASPSRASPSPTSRFPTHLSLVPTQLLRLLDHRGGRPPPERLRCVLVGGAHAPASLVARAHAGGWPIALTYGATEMSSQIATAPPELTRSVPGTVGAPIPGVEVREGSDGELRTRGATLALGYVGGGGALVDEDGWYRTGDLGRIDDDGRLWITGRRIDRIVSGGVTVDAVEVEEALRAHPTVIDACVVGIPDEEWGERVGAWVEPVVGELELEELERHLRERLMPAKLPRVWRVHGALPRNANGKVDRGAVRAALAG